jgi:hypothetical protein
MCTWLVNLVVCGCGGRDDSGCLVVNIMVVIHRVREYARHNGEHEFANRETWLQKIIYRAGSVG